MFNLTANDLFDRDDLLQGIPEGAYRVACPITTPTMRVGEGALTAERTAGKVLHGKAQADSSTHPDNLYMICSRAASSSTPNLSTLQRSVSLSPNAAKLWSPSSPSLSFERTPWLRTALQPLPWEEMGFCYGGEGFVYV